MPLGLHSLASACLASAHALGTVDYSRDQSLPRLVSLLESGQDSRIQTLHAQTLIFTFLTHMPRGFKQHVPERENKLCAPKPHGCRPLPSGRLLVGPSGQLPDVGVEGHVLHGRLQVI